MWRLKGRICNNAYISDRRGSLILCLSNDIRNTESFSLDYKRCLCRVRTLKFYYLNKLDKRFETMYKKS